MAATFVQAASGSIATNGSTIVTGTGGTAFGSNVTAGNTIVVGVNFDNNARTCTCADNLGNTYGTRIAKISQTGGSGAMQMFYAFNIAGGACTITATLDGGDFERAIVAVELTGTLTTDPADVGITSSDNAEAGTAVDTGAIVPSVNGCCLVALASGTTAHAQTWTQGSPFTERIEVAPGGFQALQVQTFDQTTAASVTPAWTLSSTGAAMCMAASFKPAAGAGRTTKNSRTTNLGMHVGMDVRGGPL